jgi:hypothetical protein
MKTIKAQERFNEPVTEASLEQAIKRGRTRHEPHLYATAVSYLPTHEALLVSFADQSALLLPVHNYPELSELNKAELAHLELGFGGSALCLEEKDLHVSITGLISASDPLMAMASMVVAARNGSRRSPAKAQSSRENGQKGGRPRKLAMS